MTKRTIKRYGTSLVLGLISFSISGCKKRNFSDLRQDSTSNIRPYESTIPENQFDMVSYWKKCAEHLGEPPTFNYNQSVLVPLFQQRKNVDVTDDPHVTEAELLWANTIPAGSPRRQTCNTPTGVGRDDKENLACVPASRALRVDTVNAKGEAIMWQVLYRRLSADHEAPPGDKEPLSPNSQYDVQNLIAKNLVTGATCFADSEPTNAFYRSEDGKVTRIYDADDIKAKTLLVTKQKAANPKSVAKVFFSITGSDFPNLTKGDPEKIRKFYKPMFADCTRCHNHNAWTRNPWISQVKFPAGSGASLMPEQVKLAMAKQQKIRPQDSINMALEPYFIVEQENVRKLLAKVTQKPKIDANPYSLDIKILNTKDNKCRTCHEIGQRHMCGETVPMAFGLNRAALGGNGFGIDYRPPEIFERRLVQYFASQNAQTWPENGWHNKILNITKFATTENSTDKEMSQSFKNVQNYQASLDEVMACCQTFQAGEKLPPQCKWVRPPHVPGRNVVNLASSSEETGATGFVPPPPASSEETPMFPKFDGKVLEDYFRVKGNPGLQGQLIQLNCRTTSAIATSQGHVFIFKRLGGTFYDPRFQIAKNIKSSNENFPDYGQKVLVQKDLNSALRFNVNNSFDYEFRPIYISNTEVELELEFSEKKAASYELGIGRCELEPSQNDGAVGLR